MNPEQTSDTQPLNGVDDSGALAELKKTFEKISELKRGGTDEVIEDAPEEPVIEESRVEDEIIDLPEEENSELIPMEEETIDLEKKEKKPDKYRKLQNDKYRALSEKVAAEERVKELEYLLGEALNSGNYHYGKNVYADLERAKEAKIRSLEEADTAAVVKADEDITRAIIKINELEKWEAERNSKQSHVPEAVRNNNYQQPEPTQWQIEQEIAADWLENHPDLRANSRVYNPQLYQVVANYISKLDANLEKTDRMHLYYSPSYFNTIDNYIHSLKTRKESVSKNIAPVGGVRKSSPSTSREKSNRVELTELEKRIAINSDLDPEVWRKKKEEYLQADNFNNIERRKYEKY